jgi:hypothetical protein
MSPKTRRGRPGNIERFYATAIRCGARHRADRYRWHATLAGAKALVRFVIEQVVKPSGEEIPISWHDT